MAFMGALHPSHRSFLEKNQNKTEKVTEISIRTNMPISTPQNHFKNSSNLWENKVEGVSKSSPPIYFGKSTNQNITGYRVTVYTPVLCIYGTCTV